jgi:hypothetical protein
MWLFLSLMNGQGNSHYGHHKNKSAGPDKKGNTIKNKSNHWIVAVQAGKLFHRLRFENINWYD